MFDKYQIYFQKVGIYWLISQAIITKSHDLSIKNKESPVRIFLHTFIKKHVKRIGKPQLNTNKIGKSRALKKQCSLGPSYNRARRKVGLGGSTGCKYFIVK